MKLYELIELPKDELEARLENARLELANMRFQKATHQLQNPLQIRELRKEIAKINTLLREYELEVREPKQAVK